MITAESQDALGNKDQLDTTKEVVLNGRGNPVFVRNRPDFLGINAREATTSIFLSSRLVY